MHIIGGSVSSQHPAALVVLAIAGALAVADWVGVVRADRRLRWIAKPGMMVALIVAVLTVDATPSGVSLWIAIGLALSLAGDVFLLLADEKWFTPGLAAFLLAHIAFIVAMAHLHLTRSLFGVALIVVAFGIGTLGIRVVGGAGRHDRSLQVPVLMYVCVISLMVATAISTKQPWLIAAAICFYASDLMLGWDRFVKARTFSGLAVMITYHLAQAEFVIFVLTR